MKKLFPLLAMVTLLASCVGTEEVSVRLDLLFRAGSCFPPTSWDTSCVQSIEIVLAGVGKVFARHCEPVSGYTHLQDLVTGPAELLLENATPRKNAWIEIRGYHGLADKGACAKSLSTEDLMFWGRSEPIDLKNAEVSQIEIPIECRPDCDCAQIDRLPDLCPPSMPTAVCGPPVSLPCRNGECMDDADCFDGELACVDLLCREMEEGAMCAPCSQDEDCQSGVCIHHEFERDVPFAQVDESYCAEVCPPVDGSAAGCPSGMSCKRLDGTVFSRISPPSDP